MSKTTYKEALAYNEKIQGHVDAINKLIKVVSKGGVRVVAEIRDDNTTIADSKVPEIRVETSLKL